MTRYCWFFRPLNYDKERLRHRRKGLFFLLPGSGGGPLYQRRQKRQGSGLHRLEARGGILALPGKAARPPPSPRVRVSI